MQHFYFSFLKRENKNKNKNLSSFPVSEPRIPIIFKGPTELRCVDISIGLLTNFETAVKKKT